jgi:hypothetical protein
MNIILTATAICSSCLELLFAVANQKMLTRHRYLDMRERGHPTFVDDALISQFEE